MKIHLNRQGDYVRTRLTHSLEVAQVGNQLARIFTTHINPKAQSSYLKLTNREYSRDPIDLTSSACLMHDIGQSPFGHKGEKTLNEIPEAMAEFIKKKWMSQSKVDFFILE